jgi:hypothetical protein
VTIPITELMNRERQNISEGKLRLAAIIIRTMPVQAIPCSENKP